MAEGVLSSLSRGRAWFPSPWVEMVFDDLLQRMESKEWENSHVTVKSGRHYLDQGVKINVISDKSHTLSYGVMQKAPRRCSILSNHNPRSITSKH